MLRQCKINPGDLFSLHVIWETDIGRGRNFRGGGLIFPRGTSTGTVKLVCAIPFVIVNFLGCYAPDERTTAYMSIEWVPFQL